MLISGGFFFTIWLSASPITPSQLTQFSRSDKKNSQEVVLDKEKIIFLLPMFLGLPCFFLAWHSGGLKAIRNVFFIAYTEKSEPTLQPSHSWSRHLPWLLQLDSMLINFLCVNVFSHTLNLKHINIFGGRFQTVLDYYCYHPFGGPAKVEFTHSCGTMLKCDRSDYVGIYLRIYLHSLSSLLPHRQKLN